MVRNNSVYTADEAAALLKTSADTVRLLCRKGKLKAVNIGAGKTHIWRISEQALQEFMQSPASPATPPTEARPRRNYVRIV